MRNYNEFPNQLILIELQTRNLSISILNRSQKTSHLQRESGLFLAQHGLSRSGQAAGPIMGDSVHRRTIDNERDRMAKNHKTTINEHIKEGLEVRMQILTLSVKHELFYY